MEDKKKARCEGEEKEVPKGQVIRPSQESTVGEDVRDVASERASVVYFVVLHLCSLHSPAASAHLRDGTYENIKRPTFA